MRSVPLQKTAGLLAYLGLLGSVAAVAQEATPLSLALFSIALAVGFVLDRRPVPRPVLSVPFLVLLAIAGIFFCLKGIDRENFFGRILSVLLVITAAKLVYPKRARDLLQLYLLNLLLVAAAAVTRWGLEFGVLVLLETFLCVTGLVFIYGSQEQEEVSTVHAGHLFRVSGVIALFLIPSTVILFLVVPRPTGLFFSLGARTAARSGFGDRVSPGAVENILTDPSPAFRVRWLTGTPPQKPYWRGMVYDTYRDGAWEKRFKERIPRVDLWEKRVQYEVLLEPSESEYLLSLGLPYWVSPRPLNPYLVSGYTLEASKRILQRSLYRVGSYMVESFPPDTRPDVYLGIPDRVREGLQALAGELRRRSTQGTARAVESFLRGRFAYTLSPGKSRGDPVLYFLLESRKGHCEYFASAMVLLLRTLGIPGRIVAGYAGGEWNELGQYFLVRQSNAHTWVEVWEQDRGWVPFDPTPATVQVQDSALQTRLLRIIDLLRFKWYYWVLDYDLNRQMDLARRTLTLFRTLGSTESIGEFSLGASELKRAGVIMLLVLSLFGLRLAWIRYRRRPRTPVERFVRVLEEKGFRKKRAETLREFALRIGEGDTPLGRRAAGFVDAYYLLEYGRRGREETLVSLLEEIRKAPGEPKTVLPP
ncbi:MAG: DUF3488 domain-containing protein [Deltaproteobacteria bacterium]|nr:DUF3488 domain-containing protein [Deltaproteobacteria bacterium]